MTQDAWIRARIQEALDRFGWSQAELCRRTNGVVKAGTLSSFMRGRTKNMSEEKLEALGKVLGTDLIAWPPEGGLRGHTSIPNTLTPESYSRSLHLDPYGKAASIVPVVDFSRFPTGMEGQKLRDELEKIASRHRLSSVADPAAFSVPLKSAFESFEAGDELTFSPATPAVHQDFVAVEDPASRKPRLAKFLVLEGEEFALLSDGSYLKSPKILGVAADLWRPLLSETRR